MHRTEALDALRAFVGNLPLVCHDAAFDQAVILNGIDRTGHSWRRSNRWNRTLRTARLPGAGRSVGPSPGRPEGVSCRLEDMCAALALPLDPAPRHRGHCNAERAGLASVKLRHLRGTPIVRL